MYEYTIPAARIISAAVVGICFVIALLVINMQAAGRRRTYGLLGIIMIATSTGLQAANVSMASVYGKNTVAYELGSVLVAVLGAAGLVLLALAVTRGRKGEKGVR